MMKHPDEWYDRTVGLCAGRHEIPVEEYLFPDPVDPLDFDTMYKRASFFFHLATSTYLLMKGNSLPYHRLEEEKMKKVVGILEFVSKLCAAVIMMEIAANTYICVSTGFRLTWTWTDFQDMVIGYPLILGAAWVAFHADSLWDKAVGLLHRDNKKPQFVVTRGGDIEGR